MRVAAKITNRQSGKAFETSLLLNTGYEAPGPRILLPQRLAEELGIGPGGVRVEAKTSVGIGALTDPGLRVTVEAEGKRVAEADVRVSGAETEAIANDVLIELLGIEIVRPGEGLYRFYDDPMHTTRKSVPPKTW